MKAGSSKIAAVLLLIYAILLIYWMFLGFGRTWDFAAPYRYNLHPLRTITSYIRSADILPFSVWGVNLLGNVAVFIPVGALLAVMMQRRPRLLHMLAGFLPALLLLELLQMVLRAGSFDVDDVLLNTAGACLGWVLVARAFFGKRQRQT
ncbi:VanZ family protein [Paenibacillus jiagnxiensis]|uniref:VanZ family protein n=1 Tax=Paenibacillus jiagnxiensis TaxID=3228926 RepID=UPI0033B5BDEF